MRCSGRRQARAAMRSGSTPAACAASARSMKRPSSRIIAAWRAGLHTRSTSENADWRRKASLTSSAHSSVSCWRAGRASLPMMRAMRSRCACSSSSVRKRRRSAEPLAVAMRRPPRRELARVFGVTLQRVDRGVEAGLRALHVEGPEGLHIALGVARHRLREVARRRADRAHHRHRTGAAGEGVDQRGAFVEVGQAAATGRPGSRPRRAARRSGPTPRAAPRPSGWCCRPSAPRAGPGRGSTRRP